MTRHRAFPIRGTLCLLLLLTLQLGAWLWSADAYGKAFDERQIKAAFIYNLANFVTWPAQSFEDPQAPFRICVLGDDSLAPFIEQVVAGENIAGRPIAVERLTAPSNIPPCQILFVGEKARGILRSSLAAVADQPTLTVSDIPAFIHQGGMVNLVKKRKRLRLEIDPKAASRNGLIISSKLLKLARIVEGPESKE